jgi:hypothetical protein
MNRSVREAISPLSLDAGPRWPVERHVMMRIDYVVSQVSITHAGQSEADIARLITDRLRGLGVTPVPRHIQEYALAISQLPPTPPPPRPR